MNPARAVIHRATKKSSRALPCCLTFQSAAVRSRNRRIFFLLCFVCSTSATSELTRADEHKHTEGSATATVYGTAELTATVGMTGRITQLFLPGSELAAISPHGRENPVIIRIDATYPHGDGFRYDLTWSSDLPGDFNLAESLRRIDGSSPNDLPQISVSVSSVLAPERLTPNAVVLPQGGWVGGYRATITLLWILWAAGLAALGFRHLKNQRRPTGNVSADGACQLRAIRELLTQALSSESFSAAGKLQLEKLIISFWTTQKQLEELPPRELLAQLRNDHDAGPLLAELERWLYDRPRADDRYISELLEPMQRILETASRQSDAAPGAA